MKTSLDEAIGTVPPAAVDVDAVIRRGRRTLLVRRAGMATGAGVAVLAALITQAPARGGIEPPAGNASAPASPVPAPGPVSADIKKRLDATVADRIAKDTAGASIGDRRRTARPAPDRR